MAKMSPTPLLTNNGDINLKQKDGKEEVKGDRGGTGSGNNFDVEGSEEGKGWTEDKEGDEKGRNVTRQRKGININIRQLSDKYREYIVSDEAIIINENHPTYTRCKKIGVECQIFNALRCASMAVIEYSLPEENKKVLKDLSNFLRVWGDSSE